MASYRVRDTLRDFDRGALRASVEQCACLASMRNRILADLSAKKNAGSQLEDDDVLMLIILPLTQPDKGLKQKLIEDAVSLAKRVQDERQKLFAIAGIVTATNKFIDSGYLKNLKGWFKMTKLARLYEEEEIDAVNQTRLEIARNLIESGLDITQVMQATGLTRAELDAVQTLMPAGA